MSAIAGIAPKPRERNNQQLEAIRFRHADVAHHDVRPFSLSKR